MRIISWNVNGLRACTRKGYSAFLGRCKADIVALQEVRAYPEQLETKVRSPKNWHTHFFPAQRPGYSGVGVYSRQAPDRIETSLGEDQFDCEGRFMVAHFGRMAVASVYFPKGSGKDRDNSRVPYKLAFCEAVFDRIEHLKKRGPVFVAGDYNTAHQPIDLARPKTNIKSSGFLPIERAELSRWLDAGWVDTFRALHPNQPDHYTWWRQFGGAREDNIGWRIDYVLASPSAFRKVERAFIWPGTLGSDHCPVGVDLKR